MLKIMRVAALAIAACAQAHAQGTELISVEVGTQVQPGGHTSIIGALPGPYVQSFATVAQCAAALTNTNTHAAAVWPAMEANFGVTATGQAYGLCVPGPAAGATPGAILVLTALGVNYLNGLFIIRAPIDTIAHCNQDAPLLLSALYPFLPTSTTETVYVNASCIRN